MKVYVAGRTSELALVRNVQELARSYGHTITFDWTGGDGMIRNDWLSTDETKALGEKLAEVEVRASKCDLLILCLPFLEGGVGCYVELGVALGHGAKCLILNYGSARDSVFFCHPSVTMIHSWSDLSHELFRTSPEEEQLRFLAKSMSSGSETQLRGLPE